MDWTGAFLYLCAGVVPAGGITTVGLCVTAGPLKKTFSPRFAQIFSVQPFRFDLESILDLSMTRAHFGG